MANIDKTIKRMNKIVSEIESFDEKMNRWMGRFENDPMNEIPVSFSQRKKGYPPPPPMTAITKTHIPSTSCYVPINLEESGESINPNNEKFSGLKHETEYYDPRTLEKLPSLPKFKNDIENGGIISYDQQKEINELIIYNSSLKEKCNDLFNENKRILDTNQDLGRKLNKLQQELDIKNIKKKKEVKIKARVDKVNEVKSTFGNVGKRIVGWFYE